MGTIFFFTLTVPYDSPTLISADSKAAASPMTIALVNAGWQSAGNLINAFILVAVISAINSCIYLSSRTILFLAAEGKAPRFLSRTTSKGVPINAILFSNLFGLIALINSSKRAGRVYSALVNFSSVSTFIVWAIIHLTHIRHFQGSRAQNRDRNKLPYRSWWQPQQAILGLILNSLFMLIQGYSAFDPFDVVDFVIAYILLPVSLLAFLVWKVWWKTTWVGVHQMDLATGQLPDHDDDDERRGSEEAGNAKQKQISWVKRLGGLLAGNE